MGQSEGKIIKVVRKLDHFQREQYLNVANKTKRAHVEWHKQKMKVISNNMVPTYIYFIEKIFYFLVSLAAQTLSNCIADAIEFLNKDINLSDFKLLFDILNSRNPHAKSLKAKNEGIMRYSTI